MRPTPPGGRPTGAPCHLAWERRDRHRWAGPLAVGGLLAGALTALFGLPPVDLHEPWHYAGVMGPLCGATRGVRAFLHGDIGEAWRYNPLSFVLVAGAASALAREAVGRIRGRWLNLRIRRPLPLLITGLVLTVALAARQQANADLLRTSTDGGLPTGLLLYAAALPVVAVALSVAMVRRRRG